MKDNIDLSVIVPIYNEESNILKLFDRLNDVLQSFNNRYEIIFVDDGSNDQSYSILEDIYKKNRNTVRVVQFSRNFGHQLALTAGFKQARGRAAVVLDADLQDPPELIVDFVKKWEEGYDVVYGKRKEREGETWFKKWTAQLFYKLIRATTVIDIPENAGDFYLLDRKILDILNSITERHRFIRGLIAWVGFKRCAVEYIRKPRFSGETKYPLWKMIKFSWDAMTAFSFTPLRFISLFGGVISIFSFFSILIIFYQKWFTDVTITGWSSTMVVILFIGGVQLLAIGIIGEYIARIGDDVKARPLYNVSMILEAEKEELLKYQNRLIN